MDVLRRRLAGELRHLPSQFAESSASMFPMYKHKIKKLRSLRIQLKPVLVAVEDSKLVEPKPWGIPDSGFPEARSNWYFNTAVTRSCYLARNG